MSEYTVSGRFRSGAGWNPFQKTVAAPNADVAREHVYAEIGSEHGLKRARVEIDEVAPAGEVSAA